MTGHAASAASLTGTERTRLTPRVRYCNIAAG